MNFIRKPGERTMRTVYKNKANRRKKNQKQKRYHCWAAVGWNFQSELVLNEVPSHTNGKMNQRVHIDSVLEPVVKPWLEPGEDFVLEEDGDSGLGSGKSNVLRDWKNEHSLKNSFNYAHSPDLSPIENRWQVPKQTGGRQPHWDMRLQLLQSSRDGKISLRKKSMSY